MIDRNRIPVDVERDLVTDSIYVVGRVRAAYAIQLDHRAELTKDEQEARIRAAADEIRRELSENFERYVVGLFELPARVVREPRRVREDGE